MEVTINEILRLSTTSDIEHLPNTAAIPQSQNATNTLTTFADTPRLSSRLFGYGFCVSNRLGVFRFLVT